MSRLGFTKALVPTLLITILVSGRAVIGANESDTNMTEIGKDDPFKVVLPFNEAKQGIIKKVAEVTEGEEPELFVRSVMLKFLQAKNVETAARGLLSSRGEVTTDEPTNSLVICDTAERLQHIITEIQKADQTPRQIMIEVVIVDVQLDDDTEIGVDWIGPSNTENYQQTLIPSTSTTGGFLNIIQNEITTTIHLLQETRDVEILASPRVLVVSGQEASIATTEEIPYTELSQSSGGVTATDAITSTEFKEAGITLTVKATITDEGQILIDISPEQSVNTGVAGVGSSTVPIVDKRSVSTTLLMDDGQVVVMGGLRRKDTRVTISKIPLLGDLPWIGFLFSNDKVVIENSELLVFISPHIYKDEPLTEHEAERFYELDGADHLELEIKERPEFELLEELLTVPWD